MIMVETFNVDSSKRCIYSDLDILKVYYWSVIHCRPISWAVRRENWPSNMRELKLPSSSAMSRRMKSASIKGKQQQLDIKLVKPQEDSDLVCFIDGKPLTIGGCSKDRQAGYGRAAGGMAKGYKLHAIVLNTGEFLAWRIAPMNKDERVMAERMLKQMELQGYIIGDSNYDSNRLHAVCDRQGNVQFVAARRHGPHSGTGHSRQTPGRLRSMQMLEDPENALGKTLLHQRDQIERHFGNFTSWWGGLTHLPPWVRTYPRVHRWVQAKLIIWRLKMKLQMSV
jgi:hypothetical protein